MTAQQAIDQAVARLHPLRVLRTSRGLTQQQLALHVRIYERTVRNIEQFRQQPKMPVRRKLCAYFGIDFRDHHEIFGELPDCRPLGFRSRNA